MRYSSSIFQKIKEFAVYLSASFLFYLIKVFLFLVNYLVLPFLKIIYSFFSILLSFLFNKIVVKTYSFYLSFINKVGWSKIRGNFVNFIFGQKLVHLVVLIITFSIVFTNLAQGTKADVLNTSYSRPIVSHIIGSEFGEMENGLNYEEALSQEQLSLTSKNTYLEEDSNLRTNLVIDFEAQEEDSVINSLSTNEEDIAPQPQVASQATKRTEIITYTVESGDTVSTIARKFGVSVNTVLWENNLTSYSVIRPGNELRILPESGISHTVKSGDTLGAIARSTGTEINEIMESNDLTVDSKLSIGQKLIIPGGSKVVKIASNPTPSRSYTGIEAIKDIIKPEPQKAAGNTMAWPAVGNRITQYFSWRHKGLDIANKTGTPLFAADAGTVEFAGWGNGYGNYIRIDHGGGKKTLYAHMSRFYVSKGDTVTKGESIGEMGSTGWSTGPHIHFEVIINGVKYNPLNYLR